MVYQSVWLWLSTDLTSADVVVFWECHTLQSVIALEEATSNSCRATCISAVERFRAGFASLVLPQTTSADENNGCTSDNEDVDIPRAGRLLMRVYWLFSQMWNKGRESSYIGRTSENDCVDADVPEVTILLVKSFGKCYFRCFSMVQLG